MIFVVDVHYEGNQAQVAGGLFHTWEDSQFQVAQTTYMGVPCEYIPGEFYKRELPCIMRLLSLVLEDVTTIVVDSYVDLGPKAGLGRHLYDALNGKIPVLGVAKSRFRKVPAAKVFRGRSTRPLYITAAGMSLAEATDAVLRMHGKHRIPTLLKVVDRMARGKKDSKRRSGKGKPRLAAFRR